MCLNNSGILNKATDFSFLNHKLRHPKNTTQPVIIRCTAGSFAWPLQSFILRTTLKLFISLFVSFGNPAQNCEQRESSMSGAAAWRPAILSWLMSIKQSGLAIVTLRWSLVSAAGQGHATVLTRFDPLCSPLHFPRYSLYMLSTCPVSRNDISLSGFCCSCFFFFF